MFELHCGDSLDVLRGIAENSVDAIVCDPPYGLGKEPDALAMLRDWLDSGHHDVQGAGFMGKQWDSFVPQPALWREALRVLKPGGHLLAFAGTRTMDLMAMGLRIAGFELRDSIGHAHDGDAAPLMAWVYATGFPKSLDVSKAIDKQRDDRADILRVTAFVAAGRDAAGLKNSDIDAAFGTNGMAGHWTSQKSQPAVPTWDLWQRLKELLRLSDEMDAEVWRLNGRKGTPGEGWEQRAVTGQHTGHAFAEWETSCGNERADAAKERRDEPATEAARKWKGWGTALKPAWEPIILARKPLAGTVAQNVLAHGTGALNIGACHVPFAGDADETESKAKNQHADFGSGARQNRVLGDMSQNDRGNYDAPGRWPANLIHDGSDEVVQLFPDSNGSGGSLPQVKITGYGDGIGTGKSEYFGGERTPHDAGTGSAARFFYCTKAGRQDRNEGCEALAKRPLNWSSGTQNPGSFQAEGTDKSARNHHPTVKPTALMRYLVRLVTPPGGIVLDPFMGSGSTGKACMLEGFRFIGIEREADYIEIARARIQHAQGEAAQPAPAKPTKKPRQPKAPANQNQPAAQVWQQMDLLAS